MLHEHADLVEDPDHAQAIPRGTPAEGKASVLQVAQDKAVRGAGRVVLGGELAAADWAGASGPEPRREAGRIVHVLARRLGRVGAGLQLVQADRACEPRFADRDEGQRLGVGDGGPVLWLAALEERSFVHDVDDALYVGFGGR